MEQATGHLPKRGARHSRLINDLRDSLTKAVQHNRTHAMPVNIDYSSNTNIRPVDSSGGVGTIVNATQTTAANALLLATGKSIQAQVVSIMSDGTALIKIQGNAQADTNLQVQLPAGFKVGDQLQLTVAAKGNGSPNFTFTTPGSTDTVTLSSTALLLENLISSNQQQAQVSSTTPLLASNHIDTAQLTNQLSQAIEKSGLFYESHLQQWVNGQRSLEQIRQEPQNTNPSHPEKTESTASAGNNLVPLQLDAQENKHIAWQGELWPGQSMQIEINKDTHSGQQSESQSPQETKIWQTNVKLSLPNLGDISATINFQSDQHAQLKVQVQNSATATTLKLQSDQLTQALANSGMSLDNITVHTDVNE